MIFYSCFIGFWLYVDPLSPSFGFNIDPLGKKNYFPFSSRRQITFIRLREMNILKTVVNHSIVCFETEFQNLWYKVTTDSHKVTFSPTFSLSPKPEIFRGNRLWLGARMTNSITVLYSNTSSQFANAIHFPELHKTCCVVNSLSQLLCKFADYF